MMKKWIALLLAILMAMVCAGASAQSVITGPRGPELPSTFEVDEEAGLSQGQVDENNQATMGTDVYLFVDPDTASYVTFHVYNDDGDPVPNAVIHIMYNDVQAVYGVTDENGQCSMYLFRDVHYGYLVTADGHTSQDGHIYPTSETTRVYVELMKYHTLTVYVTQGGEPVAGTVVRVNGESSLTDDNGMVVFYNLVKGTYDLWVKVPGGGYVYRKVRIDGDTVVYIDLDDYIGKGGEYEFEGGFLVYNKLYEPEDYVLTMYAHKPLDVLRKAGESDEAYQQRRQQYLDENPNTVVVQAQPEREQLTDGDRDLKNADGTLLYTQRSMMPNGALLRAWEGHEMTRVIFANEHAAVALDLAELHGEKMTKAFALVNALDQGRVNAVAAAGAELDVDAQAIDSAAIDWQNVRPFAFAFDQEAENGSRHAERLRDSLYEDAVFEFRITPVVPGELLQLVQDGMAAEPQDNTVIDLSTDNDELLKADGLLTEAERSALYNCFAGDQPAADLTAEQLLQAAVDGKMYRVSCWIHCEGQEMDVTALLDSMQVLWQAKTAYQAQLEELNENEMTDAERAQAACEALEQSMSMLSMDSQSELAVEQKAVKAVRGMAVKGEDLYSTLSRKLYRVYTVDVRRENRKFESTMEETMRRREQSYALVAESSISGLVWLHAEKER